MDKKKKSTEKPTVSEQLQDELEPIPEEISKDEADKLQDFAQDLDDEITHVVDYGDLEVDKKEKR
tara:strand:- start:894 stop:1088 length:195 start_codon:yes stop_codon:yes gene_type:complete